MAKKPAHSRKQALPLILALNKLDVEPEIKRPALEFLSMDLAQLKTRADLEKAFAGLARSEQLLSPLNIAYARSLESQRKLLCTFTKLRSEWCKVWFAEDVISVYREILKLLESHLDPEIWALIKDKMNSCFEEDPPL